MELRFLTVEAIKMQCRLDIDDESEDEMLTVYGASAEQTVLNLINMSALELLDEYTETPAPLLAAMLILTAQAYKYREASTPENVREVPWGIRSLVDPYVRLSWR